MHEQTSEPALRHRRNPNVPPNAMLKTNGNRIVVQVPMEVTLTLRPVLAPIDPLEEAFTASPVELGGSDDVLFGLEVWTTL